jgi:hypothetical protein
MTDDDAWKWLSTGVALGFVGIVLLRLHDPMLFTMWGVALSICGGAIALVGTGVLLRLWR